MYPAVMLCIDAAAAESYRQIFVQLFVNPEAALLAVKNCSALQTMLFTVSMLIEYSSEATDNMGNLEVALTCQRVPMKGQQSISLSISSKL